MVMFCSRSTSTVLDDPGPGNERLHQRCLPRRKRIGISFKLRYIPIVSDFAVLPKFRSGRSHTVLPLYKNEKHKMQLKPMDKNYFKVKSERAQGLHEKKPY